MSATSRFGFQDAIDRRFGRGKPFTHLTLFEFRLQIASFYICCNYFCCNLLSSNINSTCGMAWMSAPRLSVNCYDVLELPLPSWLNIGAYGSLWRSRCGGTRIGDGSSLWARQEGSAQQKAMLSDWPMDMPANWVKLVNHPQTAAEREAMQKSIKRSRPFGDAAWRQEIAAKLGLSSRFRDPWRPARTKVNGV